MKMKKQHRSSGFTLIEIMIVMAIMAAMLALGAPRLFNSATAMRGAVRKIAGMTREMRNQAQLTNSTMRLVISMDAEKGHSFWVESANGTASLLSAEQKDDLERMTKLQREGEAQGAAFQADTRIMKEPQNLPRGLFFESVESGESKEPVTSGTAYIHFFPQGLSESSAIHITDRKSLNWTISIHPLTGRADIRDGKFALKDIRP